MEAFINRCRSRLDFVIKLGVGIVSEVFVRVARETVWAGMLTAAIRVRTPIKRQELLVEVMQKGLAFNWLIVNGHCYLFPSFSSLFL